MIEAGSASPGSVSRIIRYEALKVAWILHAEVTTRAQELAGSMCSQGCMHGARIAAERLTNELG